MGKTSSAVKQRWKDKNYSRICVSLDKNLVETFKEKCKSDGITIAAVVKKAVEDFLDSK